MIQLGVRSYKHKQYGGIENPDFPIVGWPDAVAGKEPPTLVAAELHDSIPF